MNEISEQLRIVQATKEEYNHSLQELREFIDGLIIQDEVVPSIKVLKPFDKSLDIKARHVHDARENLYDEVSLYNQMVVDFLETSSSNPTC